jgi:transposase
MRDTFMADGTPQKMTFVDSNGETRPKGVRTILQERGLWVDGLSLKCARCRIHDSDSTTCCATRILSLQPDFLAQKCHLEETVTAAGHYVIFYPKYHCELNWIEYFWGAAKDYTRKNCDYSWSGLNRTVPEALASVSLETMRRFHRRAMRYISAYEIGLNGKQAVYAVRKYRSHRRVPASVLTDLTIMG